MAAYQQWVPLEEPLTAYLSESEQSQHKYYKCWQLAFRAMRDLGIDSFYPIKSQKLPVNANKTVTLPNDYIKYTKIGVLNQNGEVATLKRNPNLTFYADQLPDRLEKNHDDTLLTTFLPDNAPFYYWNYYDGDTWCNLYGIPSGSVEFGSFNISEAEGVVVLSNFFPYDYLIIEYLAVPSDNGKYFIPQEFYEAVIAFIRWKDTIDMPTNRRANVSEKAMRRHEYFNERRLARARYKPLYFQEARDWISACQRMVVKS